MAKRKTTTAASKKKGPEKRASGGAQRKTERIMVRLDPDVAARLRTIAGAWHVTLAEVVTDALDTLWLRTSSAKKRK